MAMTDYRLCDVCESKAFYDARLHYDKPEGGEVAAKQVGKADEWGYRLDYLGDWAVLCEDCAKTHTTAIVENDKPLVPLPDRDELAKWFVARFGAEAVVGDEEADALLDWLKDQPTKEPTR